MVAISRFASCPTKFDEAPELVAVIPGNRSLPWQGTEVGLRAPVARSGQRSRCRAYWRGGRGDSVGCPDFGGRLVRRSSRNDSEVAIAKKPGQPAVSRQQVRAPVQALAQCLRGASAAR